jgi:hypothetical protein
MRAVIVLAVVFAALHFGLKYWVAPKFGADVKARFVERLKYIPSFKTPGDQDGERGSEAALNEANFAAWLAKPDNQSNRRGYAFPVLFPLDILFLVALGSLLGMVSLLLAGQVGAVVGWPAWVWWLFPVAYMAFDLLEDVLLITLLAMPSLLNGGTFRALSAFTSGKIGTVAVAIGQVALLALACVAARLGIIS